MRAVQGRPRQPAAADRRGAWHSRQSSGPIPAKRDGARQAAQAWKLELLWGFTFFAGYLPGILLGRGGTADGAVLAAYYMDKQDFSSFGSVFANFFAGAFLQVTLALFCGFCALGIGLLALLFAVKGAYLGFCAASVFAVGGAKSLVIHWLLTCLPDIAILLLLLWLGLAAAPLCTSLFHAVTGMTAHGDSTFRTARTLLLRYLLVIAAAAAFCALGAGSAVFLAGVLL